jgi:hypothetical protein
VLHKMTTYRKYSYSQKNTTLYLYLGKQDSISSFTSKTSRKVQNKENNNKDLKKIIHKTIIWSTPNHSIFDLIVVHDISIDYIISP